MPYFAPEILRRVRLDDAMKAKKLRQALQELAEEGVVQLFRPQDGSPPMVGVVGTLQLDVLQARLAGEYGVADRLRADALYPGALGLAARRRRWRDSSPASASAMADDVDGDPVFLATSAFMMRRAVEGHPSLHFRDIKDFRPEAA